MENLVGQYITYNDEECIVVAFDGMDFILVKEEIVQKCNQIFNEEFFIRVSKEEMEQIIGDDEMEL